MNLTPEQINIVLKLTNVVESKYGRKGKDTTEVGMGYKLTHVMGGCFALMCSNMNYSIGPFRCCAFNIDANGEVSVYDQYNVDVDLIMEGLA